MNRPITQQFQKLEGGDAASDLESLIGYNLKRTYVHVQNDFREVLGNDGFAPRVFAALALVTRHPNITQSDLARLLGIERSGLVAIVDDLERRGFLKRTKVRGDRRVQALVPTSEGTDAFEAALSTVKEHERKIFGMFTAQEQAQLLELLRKFRGAMEGEA